MVRPAVFTYSKLSILPVSSIQTNYLRIIVIMVKYSRVVHFTLTGETIMNPLQLLQACVFSSLPQLKVDIEPATEQEHRQCVDPEHWWILDISGGRQEVGVQWKPNEPFCVYIGESLEVPFVTKPDFTCNSVDAALQKIAELTVG